jgi:hypothetical protein
MTAVASGGAFVVSVAFLVMWLLLASHSAAWRKARQEHEVASHNRASLISLSSGQESVDRW